MADEQGDSGWQTLLGLLLIAGLFCLGYLGVVNVVKWLTPTPPTVSLSAFFVDDAGIPAVAPDSASYGQGHIRVKGYVYQGDQPVKGGTVRITVASNSFQQSTVTSLKDGAFETEDPAFRPVRPGDAVTVTADVSFGKLSTSAGIFLNTKPPVNKLWIGLGMLAGPIVMGGVFLWAFTGKTTPGKNQTAIIFSYLVIVVVLALPIVTPVVLLRIFPEAVEAMIGEPAGLVNTHTNNQLENDTQWALNIGGYSFVPESNAPNRLATRATEKAVVEKAGANIGQENIAATSTHTTQQGSTAATESSTVAGTDQSSVSPAKTSSTDSSRQSGQGTTPVRDDSKPQTGTANAPNILTSGALKPPIVQVQGGLVIPLYVIILSVIGGAINMTRKVPFFQKEGEEASVIGPRRLPSRVGEFAMKVIRRDKVESAAPAAQSAAAGPVSTAAITSVQATPLTNGDQPKLESSAQNPCETRQRR